MKAEITDPVEKIIADAFGLEPNNDETALDFRLPNGVYIECKQFHTERITKQMARADNVIAIQGVKSAQTLASMVKFEEINIDQLSYFMSYIVLDKELSDKICEMLLKTYALKKRGQ